MTAKRPAQAPQHFIREWRKHRGYTQEQLSERCGFKTHSTLSHLENGRSEYSQSSLEALALALGCRPGDLLDLDPTRNEMLVDVAQLFRGAPLTVQQQILAVVATMLHNPTGTGPSTTSAIPAATADDKHSKH